MDMYDWLCSSRGALNEQVAEEVFGILPDGGPLLVILDGEGNFWASDSERFCCLNMGEGFVQDLQSRINDGGEPVVTQIDDCSVAAAQLSTERTHCGYVMVILPEQGPECMLANIGLVEVLLNQMSLIARLIERNNVQHELQIKQFSVYSQGEAVSN